MYTKNQYPKEFDNIWKKKYGPAPHMGASKKDAGFIIYKRMLKEFEELKKKELDNEKRK